jgi:hypothetical protein
MHVRLARLRNENSVHKGGFKGLQTEKVETAQ